MKTTLQNLSKLAASLAASLLLVGQLAAHPNHAAQPPWQAPTKWPDRIVATVTEEPTTSFSVSWRTAQTVGVAIAEIVEASPDVRFDLGAQAKKADSQLLLLDQMESPNDGTIHFVENQGLEPVIHHQVTFDDLKPDTLYAYRVRGARGHWSAWYQLKTAPAEGPIQFVFFGDAQTSIRSHISRTVAAAYKAAPHAQFYMHGGDLVNTAEYDMEWAEWFEAGGRSYRMVPNLMVPGNHDYINFSSRRGEARQETGKLFAAEKIVTPWWNAQFRLPTNNDLHDDLAGTAYDVRYNEQLHIFAIDSNGVDFEGQMAWLDKQLKASDAKWRVVTMHHPLFSFIGGNEHWAAAERRVQLLETLEANDVDLVITGHRHTYQRARSSDYDNRRYNVGEDHKVDTVFVVTASSTKAGNTKKEGWDRYSDQTDGRYTLSRYGNQSPIFTIIDIDGDTMSFSSQNPVGEVYDSFTLTKQDADNKILSDGAEAHGITRDGEQMGPYKKWDDLR
ncbi:metallophosphoesterase family protein [Ferrimonas pelagia]|uniref:Metallophosphoesterase family protein n=1 Tax=Ferrimonas pelagia TaxID=1177826 RepID=A0ABP9EKX6_9GAMM